MIDQIKKACNEARGCKVSKIMCKSYDSKFTEMFLSLKRMDCSLMMGVLTGHYLLASHAYRLGLVNDNRCRKCGLQDETVEHVLCLCPALATLRLQLLGAVQLLDLEAAIKLGPRKLLLFAKRTELFYNLSPGSS